LTSRKTRIGAFVLVHHEAALQSSYVVIYSHGNSTDIGYMFWQYHRLCRKLKVNVIGYDYSGYGLSSGSPSEKNSYSDIRAAYEYATKVLNVNPQKIIVYGQSLGSGPTCDIGADAKHPVGGVVLHSGIASGLRIFHEDLKKSPWFDCYPNVEKIRRIRCPILLIHGEEDTQVSYKHSERLCIEAAKPAQKDYCVPTCFGSRREAFPENNNIVLWWLVPNGGHNNIEEISPVEYYSKLRGFFQLIEKHSIEGK